MSPPTTRTPLEVVPPPHGFDRAGARELLKASKLPMAIHRHVRAPFGHSVGTLRTLDALCDSVDLALGAGEGLHALLLEDIARTGTLAIPEPTKDQRLFIGAFAVTVFCDAARERLAQLGPSPEVTSDLEADGMEELLERAPREVVERVCAMIGNYVEIKAKQQPGGKDTLEEREAWCVCTVHAFVDQLHGAVERLTHHGRLRPFGIALATRRVTIGERRYDGFLSRPALEPVTDIKPVKIEQIVGNASYIEAGQKLARDIAAYDLERGESPKKLNPVLFALGKPGCGKTITAHAVANYFLEYCAARDIPARFKVIRRTDWASSYQNASAGELVRIFKEEVYGFDGVCGVYWPDIDTAFASRGSGDLRMEEKQNLGAVFGIFDGTLIPKDGKWFMMCDANFMQMDEATTSRIAQNPFMVKGPETPEHFVELLRDILLRDVRRFVAPDDPRWIEVGRSCLSHEFSGRNVESIANNIVAHVQDFEYPDEYFKAAFERRQQIIDECSRRVDIDDLLQRLQDFADFHQQAEETAVTDRFEREVDEMVRQLNAGRAAAERAAMAFEAQRDGATPKSQSGE